MAALLLAGFAIATALTALAAGAAANALPPAPGGRPPSSSPDQFRNTTNGETPIRVLLLNARRVEMHELLPSQALVWSSPTLCAQGMVVVQATALPQGDVLAACLTASPSRRRVFSLCRLDGATGRVVWNQTDGTVYWNPVVRDSLMYVVKMDSGQLQARSVADGSLVWTQDLEQKGRRWLLEWASPVVNSSTILYFSNGDYPPPANIVDIYSNATHQPTPVSPLSADLITPDGRSTFSLVIAAGSATALRRQDAAGTVTAQCNITADSNMGAGLNMCFSRDSSILFHALSADATAGVFLEAFDVSGDSPSCAQLWARSAAQLPSGCNPYTLVAGVDAVFMSSGSGNNVNAPDGSASSIYAFDAKTGETRWTANLTSPNITAADEPVLFLGPGGSTLIVTLQNSTISHSTGRQTGRSQRRSRRAARSGDPPHSEASGAGGHVQDLDQEDHLDLCRTAVFVLEAASGNILGSTEFDLPVDANFMPWCALPSNTTWDTVTSLTNACLFS